MGADVLNPVTPVLPVTACDEPWPFFRSWHHHFWPKLASSTLNFRRRKRSFQWYFTNHCEILAKKIAKRIGLLKHISPYLKRNQREIYYKAVIKPVILYGANICTSTSKGNINSIFKLQKRAARIILDAEPRSRSVPLFNLLNWIPFYHESYAIRCSLLLKRILGKTPVYLKQMLKLNSDTHNRQ